MAGVKTMLGFLSVLMVLMGGVWILQGLNILPGSYMTADIAWTYRGAVMALIGLGVLVWSLRTPGMWKDILGAIGVVLLFAGIVLLLNFAGVLPGPASSAGAPPTRGLIFAAIGAALVFVATRGAKA